MVGHNEQRSIAMSEATTPPGLSTIQAAVQIIQNMAQCGMSGADYERDIENLHGLMSEHAFRELRTNNPREIAAAGYAPSSLQLIEVTHEQNENTAMAEAYWAHTSAFFRKVYQALAAAA
jgi:hypothetical protein